MVFLVEWRWWYQSMGYSIQHQHHRTTNTRSVFYCSKWNTVCSPCNILTSKKESNRVCVRRKGGLYDNDLSLLIQFRHKHKTLSPQFTILPYYTANNQIFSREKSNNRVRNFCFLNCFVERSMKFNFQDPMNFQESLSWTMHGDWTPHYSDSNLLPELNTI